MLRLRRAFCLPVSICFFVIVLSSSGFSTPLGPSNEGSLTQEDQLYQEKSQQILQCLHGQLSERRKDPRHPDHALFLNYTKPSKYTEVAIFEFVTKNLGDFERMDPQQFCRDMLMPVYLKAYRATFEQRSKEAVPDFAPPGRQSIESDSIFIQAYHNTWGHHDLGHSDITKAALALINDSRTLWGQDFQKSCECPITDDAIILISRAAQASDLYKWTDERYHAHTPDYEDVTQDEKLAKIRAGQEHFYALLTEEVRSFKEAARNGIYDKAAFHLGIAAHLTQDAVYHHGITLRQHSGLAYIKGFKNPDYPDGAENVPPDGLFPTGSSAAQSFEQATEATAKLIQLAVQGVPRRDIKRIFGWENDGFFSYTERAREIFHGEEDISLWELFKYYRLHKRYSSPFVELEEVEAKTCPWDPSVVLNTAFSKLISLQ